MCENIEKKHGFEGKEYEYLVKLVVKAQTKENLIPYDIFEGRVIANEQNN